MATSVDPRGGYDTDLFDRLVELEGRSFWFRARTRLIVQLAREHARPGDRVLEIGCGTGYVLRALVRDCQLRATGAELHPEGLEHARRRVPEAELVTLDARAMPFEASFDLAGAFDVLEHIDDDLAVLRGLHTALRPGGHLLITVPQHRWLWSTADVSAHHVRRYRRPDLLASLGAAGFQIVRATSFVTSLLPLMLASRWIRRGQSPDSYNLASELVPAVPLNRLFEHMLDGERALIGRGFDLPAGGSLVVVARRG